MVKLTWFITGTSSGIGASLVEAALARGDRVIAASRNSSKLGFLKSKGAIPVDLDVNAASDVVKATLQKIDETYGPIDVCVNNAGYGELGSIEETDLELIEKQYQTNVFGPIKVAQAILPKFRQRKSGLLLNVGSRASVESYPYFGLYDSSKAALLSLSSTLDEEIKLFGLRSIVLEIGAFKSLFFDTMKTDGKLINIPKRLEEYEEFRQATENQYNSVFTNVFGDTERLTKQVIDLAHGEGLFKDKQLPSVVSFGKDTYDNIGAYSRNTLERLDQWKDVAFSTESS